MRFIVTASNPKTFSSSTIKFKVGKQRFFVVGDEKVYTLDKKNTKGSKSLYKKNPGDAGAAVRAAFAYLSDNPKEPFYIVFASNSYMRFVWRISSVNDINLVEANNLVVKGFIVYRDGTFFEIEGKKK